MPKWISVEEAAAKYGINKEVIWLWADMKRFPMSYEKGITTVDEESLIGFLHQNKDRVTAEYIDTLEDLCIGKTKICILYAEIIGYQDKELLNQREQIARMKEIQIVMKRQNNRIRDCECWLEAPDTMTKNGGKHLIKSISELYRKFPITIFQVRITQF